MSANTVNSLARGLMVLEAFKPGAFRLSLAEISRITNTPKATAFRLVKTLAELNYLKYDTAYKEYYLGPKVLSLGHSVLQSLEIQEIIRPYLVTLSRECGKTINFAVLDDSEMVYIERIRAPETVYLDITIGSRIPLYSTAVGRAVLAHMGEPQLAETLEKIGSDPKAAAYIRDKRKLSKTNKDIRQKGFASAHDEYRPGVGAIAVPVLNSEGIVGGINLVVAGDLVAVDEIIENYAQLMIRTSREISEALGHPAINAGRKEKGR